MEAISKRSLLLVCEENQKQTDRRFSETITKSLRVQLLKKGKVKHKRLKLTPFQRFEADPSSVYPVVRANALQRKSYERGCSVLCHSNEELHHVMY